MTILSEKRLILHITHQLPISDEKMLLLSWKSEEAYLVRNFFCLPERQNSLHFFKLGAYAYYVFPL